jgi:uncharacterized protein (TIGR02996 family)
MFAIVVEEETTWRKAFAKIEITIGSHEDSDLVIAGADRRHARMVRKDGRFILVDLKSDGGTWLNARRLTAPVVVNKNDMITIAGTPLRIVTLAYEAVDRQPVSARDPVEASLLAAIDQREPGGRTVYADWLEERGDHERAEVLRLQEAGTGEDRVRELVSAIEPPWRARVSLAPIENCVKFKFQCPKQWSELASTGVEGERHCATCQRRVYYCATIDEARRHAKQGNCVAVDVASPRWKNDLDAPFGERVCYRCQFDVGSGLERCPRCGERIEDDMMMGEIA